MQRAVLFLMCEKLPVSEDKKEYLRESFDKENTSAKKQFKDTLLECLAELNRKNLLSHEEVDEFGWSVIAIG